MLKEFQRLKALKKPILFTFPMSSCSWRIRTILNLKKIEYSPLFINLLTTENEKTEFQNINPSKFIPALFIEDQIITESMAIAEFLEEKFPQKKNLLNKNLILKTKIRTICELINAGTQPFQNLRTLKEIDSIYKGGKLAWANKFNFLGLKAVEKVIGESKGLFCVGDEITLADCFLLPQYRGAVKRFGIKAEDFPNIEGVYRNLKDLEEFRRAFPENQEGA